MAKQVAYVSPDTRYGTVIYSDGTSFCACPSWRFQKIPAEDRSCKHTRALAVIANMASSRQAPVAAAKPAPTTNTFVDQLERSVAAITAPSPRRKFRFTEVADDDQS